MFKFVNKIVSGIKNVLSKLAAKPVVQSMLQSPVVVKTIDCSKVVYTDSCKVVTKLAARYEYVPTALVLAGHQLLKIVATLAIVYALLWCVTTGTVLAGMLVWLVANGLVVSEVLLAQGVVIAAGTYMIGHWLVQALRLTYTVAVVEVQMIAPLAWTLFWRRPTAAGQIGEVSVLKAVEAAEVFDVVKAIETVLVTTAAESPLPELTLGKPKAWSPEKAAKRAQFARQLRGGLGLGIQA